VRALSTLLVLVLLGPPTVALAVAQEQPAPASVVIKTKTNAGNFAYKPFYRIYSRILGLLPPAPRMLDPVLQMSMPDLSLAEQDAYLKDGWNVAIVGDGLEIDLPTLRGGYYVFPTDEIVAAADATVMFNTRTEHNWVRLAWKVRLREAQTLGYQDFAKALAEVAAFQAKVPWYSITMREEKRAKFNGLKACFAAAGGAILVDGKTAPTVASANCLVYRFDPLLVASSPEIKVVGAVDIVVLEDAARYPQQL
jgi:hypothetical protein